MVDGIALSQHGLGELQADSLQQKQPVDSVQSKPQGAPASASQDLLLDQADISEAAYARLKSEQRVFQFVSVASRQEDVVNSDKVSAFKTLFESGQINTYLDKLGNDALAGSLLASPVGKSVIKL